jgi:threonine dehydrogenase-like Zn-dependent dehydrogenase
MKALTVVPLQAGTAAFSDMPEPPESDGPVLVETVAVGVCGTDIEILYEAAADALAKADRTWLERLVTRRVPLDRWEDALRRQPEDVKVVIEVNAA